MMRIDTYDKLVRDNIPSIIKKSGDIPIIHQISGEKEILNYLSKKICEETEEFLEDYSISELADLVEVLLKFMNILGYTEDEIINKRRNKNLKCGAFENMVVLDKVIRRMDMNEFNNRSKCDVYIPFTTHNDEQFLVELLDLCECYLEPLKYGVNKRDVEEFIEYEKKGLSFVDFLKNKRYIADSNCFLELAKKYITSNNCLKITFENVNYSEIECFFSEYTISEIRNGNINNYICIDGKINDEGEFLDDSE